MSLQQVIQNILPMIIPIIIMKGDISALCIPIILYIVIPIIDKCEKLVKKHLFKRYTYLIYEYDISAGDNHRIYNAQFRNVTFWLEKHGQFPDTLMCHRSAATQIEIAKGWYTSNPQNVVAPNSEITLCINDMKFIISSHISLEGKGIHNTFYKIIANNNKEFRDLLEHLAKMEVEFIHKACKNGDVKFNFYSDTQSKYISNNINVTKTFDNIFLEKNIRDRILTSIEYFSEKVDWYVKMGIQRKIGIILYGPPGNGKTSLAIALSHTYKKQIFKLDLSLNKHHFFNQITDIRPGSIVLIDDVDTFPVTNIRSIDPSIRPISDNLPQGGQGGQGGQSGDDKNRRLLLSDVLEVLDGYYYLRECIVIATTNHIEKLDPAFIRPGRFDHKIEINNMSKAVLIQIINCYFEEELSAEILKEIPDNLNISVSEFINSIIIPHAASLSQVTDQIIKISSRK